MLRILGCVGFNGRTLEKIEENTLQLDIKNFETISSKKNSDVYDKL